MRKFLLTLAVLCGTVSAWAQKLVTSVQEGKYYTLECNSGSAHLTTRFLGENGYGLNGKSAKPTYLIFEATDGGYYVKSSLTGMYLNQGESFDVDKYVVAYSKDAATVWTVGKLAKDATDIYLTIGNSKLYLNNNSDNAQKLQIVKHDAIGTGNACSLWEMREHEDGYKVIESIGGNITDLNQLTDGSYVVFYNAGRQKYIYEGTHDHKLYMGGAPAVGAGHKYIFRVRKENDKYAFMSVSSGRYFSSPLDGQDVFTCGIDNSAKDEFTITTHTEDNTKWLIKSSNINKWWDAQDARFVGWNGNGTNSRYEIKPVNVKNLEHDLAAFITTDENIIKWVNIKNVRSGKYATYEGESTKMTQKDDKSMSKAFFYMAGTLETDPDATVRATVKIHNFATDNLCAEYNSWTSAGTNWNIMASEGQNIHAGWAISKGTDLDNGNAWNNEGGGGSTIAYWNGNDQGSTWAFEAADYYTLNSKLEGLKKEMMPVLETAKSSYGEGNVTEDPVILSATEGENGYLYCNAAGENNPYDSDKAGVAALIDGNDNTFLHTDYTGANSKDGLDHYIRVDMGEGKAIDYFSFGYKTRKTNGGNEPKRILIEGSNDGTKYYEITTLTNLPSGTGVTYASETLGGKPYRYLRFMVKETTNGSAKGGHQFFALASFNLNKVSVKEGSEVKTLVYNSMSNAIEEAEAILESTRSTEDEINGIKNLLATINAGLEVHEYPFELTKNVNDPVCYFIKSARSKEWDGNYYWTFENGKVTTIVPNDEYKKDVEAYWFFMEDPQNGQLKLVPFIEHLKPMGYTTVANGNDKLTNNTAAAGFAGSSYTVVTNTEGDWASFPYALRPYGVDNYVSNCNGKDGRYMGFWNDLNDHGTRFNLERAEITPSALLRDLRTALAPCQDVDENLVKDALGYYNVENYAKYKNLVETGRATYNDATLTDEEYYEVLVAFDNDPTSLLTINLPEAGKFYRIQNENATGYLSSGTGTGRTQFVEGIGEKASSIFYFTGNKLVSYTTGLYLAAGDFVNYTDVVGENAGTIFTFAPSPVWGKLLISFNNGNRSFYSNATGDSNAASKGATGEYYRFTVTEVDWLPVPMNTELGYATIYSPVELELSQNRVKAYTATINESGNAITLTEQSVVPANTGVVLEYQKGAEIENGYVFLQIKETTLTNVESQLCGTLADSYVDGDGYILAKPGGYETGFYKAMKNFTVADNGTGTKVAEGATGTHFLNNGFKAYLPKPASSEARFYVLDFGTETTIENIEGAESANDAVIYDLAGRRVQGAQKGLYIVNGKKVIK